MILKNIIVLIIHALCKVTIKPREVCMSQPILYIDKSDIREGKLDELKENIVKLIVFIKKNIPQIISYRFSLVKGMI